MDDKPVQQYAPTAQRERHSRPQMALLLSVATLPTCASTPHHNSIRKAWYEYVRASADIIQLFVVWSRGLSYLVLLYTRTALQHDTYSITAPQPEAGMNDHTRVEEAVYSTLDENNRYRNACVRACVQRGKKRSSNRHIRSHQRVTTGTALHHWLR